MNTTFIPSIAKMAEYARQYDHHYALGDNKLKTFDYLGSTLDLSQFCAIDEYRIGGRYHRYTNYACIGINPSRLEIEEGYTDNAQGIYDAINDIRHEAMFQGFKNVNHVIGY